MKLLVFTQALDRNDPVLSAYHRLVAEIARNFDSVTVVCLKKGDFDMPSNVQVLSLGKEEGESRLKYLKRFFRYIFTQKYEAVFVHMNQEYVLLGGLYWRLAGKPVYMWRNHHAGSMLTDLAAALCTKVFCTSRYSYTAKYKKTVLMPVGIDTEVFKRVPQIARDSRSILFLARMAPVKKPHVLVEALALLDKKGVEFRASFYGDPLPRYQVYYNELLSSVNKAGLSHKVKFSPGVSNARAVELFNSHELFVNLSSSGMYDKTIFEAMACESMVVATNRNLEGEIDTVFVAQEDNASDIAERLGTLLVLAEDAKLQKGKELREYASRKHSLRSLGDRLKEEIA